MAAAIRIRERVAYGGGDLANGLVFNAATIYLIFFYTEYLGLSAAQASLLLLVARVWDAFVDPLMGIVADRTNSRFGRYRPWLLAVPIPLALVGVAAYTVPPLGAGGRLLWAYATHLTLMTLYSAVNIPYGAMPAVMTSDPAERAKLTSWRMSGSFTGGILISLAFLPVAGWAMTLGAGGGGYAVATGLCGVIAILGYWACFRFTRERSVAEPQKTDLKGDFGAVLASRAWWWLLAMGLTMFALGIFPFYAGLYYLRYVFDAERWAPLYLGSATAGMLAGAVVNLFLVGRIERRRLAAAAALLSATACVAVLAVPAGAIVPLCLLTAVGFAAIGTGAAIVWAMVGDCADHVAAVSGRTVTALTVSAVSFSMKVGLGVGGALAGGLLAWSGFVSGVAPQADTRTAMAVMVSLVPALGHVVFAILAITFPLDRPRPMPEFAR